MVLYMHWWLEVNGQRLSNSDCASFDCDVNYVFRQQVLLIAVSFFNFQTIQSKFKIKKKFVLSVKSKTSKYYDSFIPASI